MNIQELKLSFPFDFLEHVMKTRYDSKLQYFTACNLTKGESINLNRMLTPISLTVTPDSENVSLSITRDLFQCQHGTLRCAFNTWKESNEELKTKTNVEHLSISPKCDVKKCSVILRDVLDNTSKNQLDLSTSSHITPKRSNVKKELSQTIRNTHGKGLNLKSRKRGSEARCTGPAIKKDKVSPMMKTRHVNVDQQIFTPKVTDNASKDKQISTSKTDISVDEREKQDLMKSINLRPSRNIVDWSSLVESDDSHDAGGDAGEVSLDTSPLNADVYNTSAPRDPDQLPGGHDEVQMSPLPIIITISPSDVPRMRSKFQSKSPHPQAAGVKTSLAQTGLISHLTSAKLAPVIAQGPSPSPTVKSQPHHPQSAAQVSVSAPAKTLLTQSTPTTCLSDTILKTTLLSTPLKPVPTQPNQTKALPQTPTSVHPSLQASSAQTLHPQDDNGTTQPMQLNQDNASLPPTSHEEQPLHQGKKYKSILPEMGKNIAKIMKPIHKKVSTKVQTIPHVSMCKVFPVQVVPGRFQVTEGQEGQLTLIAQSTTKSDTFENIKDTKVSFYTNISKGIETKPYNYPKELKPVMIQDDISIPIVINITKVLKKKVSEQRKQEKLQVKTELVSESQDASESIYSAKKSDLNIEDRHSAGVAEHGSLKEGVTSDAKKTFIFNTSDNSSSDSEADCADETELLRPPRLSVVYTQSANMTDLESSLYTKLGIGKVISGIDFHITSSVLLKTSNERYYIQGGVYGVEGTVLLGPFALIYHPVPYLNFIKEAERAIRVPRRIYERQRKKWLKKHDKKRFSRPRGGALADRNLVSRDHDYFTDQSETRQKMEPTEGSEEVNHGPREITPHQPLVADMASKDKDVVLATTPGVVPFVVKDVAESVAVEEQEDEDSYAFNKDTELQIPVVGSLVEALGNEVKKEVVPQIADSIYEDVPFDEVPAVVAESTLASVGVQLTYRLLGKQSMDPSRQTPVVENDDSHHLPMRFTCRYCLKSVQDNLRLAEHIRTCHQDRRGFIDYARQVRYKEGFSCQYCDKAPMFHSHDSIRNHLRVHHPDKISIPEPFISRRTCQTCKKVFSTRKVLMTHIRRMHESKRLLCDKCPAIFKSEQGLRDHMNGMHENIRNYICHICGSAYVINDYLRKHIKRVHNKSQKSDKTKDTPKLEKKKPNHVLKVKKCPLCRYSFDSLSMKKHLRQIHGETKSADKKCPDCSETLSSRCLLEYHRCTTHGYTYQVNCPFCGIAYVQAKAMHDHVLSVHLDIKLHQCPICDKNFPRPSPLIDHMLSEHEGRSILEENRKLKCPHCSDIFRTHKNLVEHVLSPSHHELFPHQCPTCLKRFMHESVLDHHIRILHCNDAEFEIRCNSDKDKLVQLVLKQDVQNLEDLPPRAQEALKRLKNEGKHVMIVAKKNDKKDQGRLKQTRDKHQTLPEVETDINPTGKNEEEFTQSASPKVKPVTTGTGFPSNVNGASPKVQIVTTGAAAPSNVYRAAAKVQTLTSIAGVPSTVDSASPKVQIVTSNASSQTNVDYTGKTSDQESLKIYKIAARSGETANAVSIIQHQLLAKGTNVVTEQKQGVDEGARPDEERREYCYTVTQDPGRLDGNESGLEKYVVVDAGKQDERVLEEYVAAEHISRQDQSIPEKHIFTLDTGQLGEKVPQEIYVIQEDGRRLKVNESALGAQFVVAEDIGRTGEAGHMEVETMQEGDPVLEERYMVGKDIGQPVEGANIVVERVENYMVVDNVGSVGDCGGNLQNTVEPHYLVAEQIGRLDEDGNVIEDSVVFQEEQPVSDLMYFFQSQS